MEAGQLQLNNSKTTGSTKILLLGNGLVGNAIQRQLHKISTFTVITVSKKNYDLIGFDIHNSNKNKNIVFTELNEESKRPNGFGTFFIVKKDKYIKIPDGIKIWYGDDIQFYGIKNKAMFNVPSVFFEMSKTVKIMISLLLTS